MRKDTFALGMLRRREIVLPSLRGLLLLALAAAGCGRLILTHIQPFLALQQPRFGEILVVEGWIPDYALRQALAAFRSHHYETLLTTGGPLPQGMVFSSYGTYAQYAARTLQEWGMSADSLRAVPSPDVGRDRTYQEALSVAEWLRANGKRYTSLDLVSFSTHARRSRMLYGMALGESIRVGVYAPRDLEYDPRAWWKTSNGVRRVTDEVVAYLYAKLLFRPGL